MACVRSCETYNPDHNDKKLFWTDAASLEVKRQALNRMEKWTETAQNLKNETLKWLIKMGGHNTKVGVNGGDIDTIHQCFTS